MIGNLFNFDKVAKNNAKASFAVTNGDMVSLGKTLTKGVYDCAKPSTATIGTGDVGLVYLDPIMRDERKTLSEFAIEIGDIFTVNELITGVEFQKATSEFSASPTVGQYVKLVDGSEKWNPSASVPSSDMVYGIVVDAKPIKNNGRLSTPAFTIRIVVKK